MSIPRPAQPSMGPYAIVPGWVLALPLTHAQLAVYIALRLHCDRDRRAWPSQELLAQESRTTDRTVRTALTRFQELGLLTAERVRGFGTGSRMLYTLNDLLLPEASFLQLPEPGVPTGSQLPTATGNLKQGYRKPASELAEASFLQKGTVPRTAPDQLSRVSAREAPPGRPASGPAAPALHEDRTENTERAALLDRTEEPERAAYPDGTVIYERPAGAWVERNPPMPAGSATRHTDTLWVTPPDWRPAPEFNEATTRRGLAAARAALDRARTEATKRADSYGSTAHIERAQHQTAPPPMSEPSTTTAPEQKCEPSTTTAPSEMNEPSRNGQHRHTEVSRSP